MNEDGESSWMSTWQGEDEGTKEGGDDTFPALRGNIGDWSSFMIAMDDEDGKELTKSLSSINLKLNKQSTGNTSTNNFGANHPLSSTQSSTNTSTTSLPPLSKLKGSTGISSPTPTPSSPSTSYTNLKGSSGISSPPPSSPSTSSTSLKSFFGGQNSSNSSLQNSPSTSSTNLKGSSGIQNPNKPIIGSSKQKHVHQQFAKTSFSNLSASIHYDATNSSSSSPTSGSPITPPISLSNSPNLQGIPKMSLTNNNNNGSFSSSPGNIASSPPLSSSKESETSFLNFFGRKKKEKSFTTNNTSQQQSTISTLSIDIHDGSSTMSSHMEFSYIEEHEDVMSHGSGLEMSMNSDKIYEGWIEMYIQKKWKKKWCVLRGIHLEYYKGWWDNQQGAQDSDECGKILLNYWYSFSRPVLTDGKFHFHITQGSEVEKTTGLGKVSKLKFRSEEENIAKKWIDECEKVIKKRKETTVTLRPLADHKPSGILGNIGRGRSNTTVSMPSFEPALESKGAKVCIPNELVDCLEPDEKILLEKVKQLLDEFPPKQLPPGETPSSYRAKPRSSDGYYRVLSLDGGGLRSVMVCVLIERIAKRYPKFLDHVDVFTGTSAGSIVAAGLAFEFPPKGTRRVLELTALPVFGKKRPGFNMGNAKYFARVLRASCYVFFQDRKFYEAQRKLVVPAFQLDSAWPPEAAQLQPEVRRWQPRVFHNIGKCEGYLETDVIGDVLLRSASAPTYFPSYQGYIDGGVFANNPALSAISLAMSPSLDQIPADKIICLSIGTGLSSHYMEGGQDYDWGLLNWAPKLGNLLMGSQVDYLTQICENMLGQRFHRLNPELGENTSMDDPKLVSELATLANTIDLTKTFEFIEKYFILPEDIEPSTSSTSPKTTTTTTSPNLNFNNIKPVLDDSALSPRSLNPLSVNNSTGSLESPRNISPRNNDIDSSIPLTPR
ncbi:hypothetical protein RB653_003796 [Dictyostelium firmibasis]|uniref:Uncharacterized protein n=1 Tax=Dictyostelium firmibasis TaxID=79012 RepID=A0AAN7UI40_9MYCE